MTPAQCKEARLLLGWGSHKLASKSGVPVHVVQGFEKTGIMYRPNSMMPQIDRAAAIWTALEAAGIEFIEQEGGGAGARLRASGT